MTEPKYKPILFTAPMVRAILEGRKTQTRRIVKVQPPAEGYTLSTLIDTTGPRRNIGKHHWLKNDGFKVIDGSQPYFSEPYAVGDRLWVRETWQHSNFPFGPLDKSCAIFYRADYLNDPLGPDLELDTSSDIRRKWNPSIHMPRWASRINLEVTGVRVERLQDISENDAYKEGAKQGYDYPLTVDQKYVNSIEFFSRIWNSIHGPGSWKTNPWVWVVEFKRMEE